MGFTTSIENALEGLPNQIIDEVKVSFTGDFVQGNQNLLHVHVHSCGDGCTPKLDGLSLKWDTHLVKEIDAIANTWIDPAGKYTDDTVIDVNGASEDTFEYA